MESMNNNEYLNENKYQQTNAKVNKTGKILLIVGLTILFISVIFMILGFTGIGSSITNNMGSFESNNFNGNLMQNTASGVFGKFGLFAIGAFMSTIGFALSSVGGIILLISHKREITAYTVQQTMPIAQEGIEKMAPTIGKAAGTIAKGIKDGLKDSEK